MICHGQGDPRTDPFTGGCCFVNGQVCPMRWYVDATGATWDSARTNLGDLSTAIRARFGVNNPNIRQDIINFLGWKAGTVLFVCTAAGQAAADHWAEFMTQTGGVWDMTNRAQFETRWSEEFQIGGVAVAVGDAWAGLGKPRNWCVTYGPGEGQCCHSESVTVNNARRANLTTTAVSVRSKAQGAS